MDKLKIEDTDLYGLLEVESTATEQEIRQAYRKKALKCHPDKNPDNPAAAERFLELQFALQILIDEKGRKAYDKVLNAKKAAELRHRELDSKRKKLKEELDARERLGELRKTSVRTDAEELQIQIERLRKEGAKLIQDENEILQSQLQKKVSESVPWDSSKYRIKIKWTSEKMDESNGGYTSGSLQRFLSKYGDVTAFVMSPKKKGSAMVEFANQEAAEMAVQYEKGLPENPLTLSWINGAPPVAGRVSQPVSSLLSDKDFESLVTRKLRQAEERKRLLEQLQADDE